MQKWNYNDIIFYKQVVRFLVHQQDGNDEAVPTNGYQEATREEDLATGLIRVGISFLGIGDRKEGLIVEGVDHRLGLGASGSTSVVDPPDEQCHANSRREARQSDRGPGREIVGAIREGKFGIVPALDDHADAEPVNGQHTRHDYGDKGPKLQGRSSHGVDGTAGRSDGGSQRR